MKKLIAGTLIVISSISTVLAAEQHAITGNGDEVILYDNGTWTYVGKDKPVKKAITFNHNKFIRSKSALFLVKSKKNNSGFYINPKKWSFKKGSGVKEYRFKLRDKDVYAMAITEQIESTLDGLAFAAFVNAKNVAPDVKIIKEEYRIVNGNKIIYMEMSGSIRGG